MKRNHPSRNRLIVWFQHEEDIKKQYLPAGVDIVSIECQSLSPDQVAGVMCRVTMVDIR